MTQKHFTDRVNHTQLYSLFEKAAQLNTEKPTISWKVRVVV